MVMQNQKSDAGIVSSVSTPGPLAAALKAEIPGIINSGRLSWDMDELAVVGDKSIKESGMYADPSLLSMYALPFVYGNPATALNDPNAVVISESMSQKFFGNSNPVGKTIQMNAKAAYSVDGLYTITGVFKDMPSNCDYHFQWLSPYTTWEDANTWLKPWTNNLTRTIVELSPTAEPAAINKKLINYLSAKVSGSTNQCFLFSMNDWHLRGNFVNGVQDGGNIKYVKLFSTIAIIILLIACINFMNLATARSEQRAREVGVLKVMGAGRKGLIGKFIGESLLMSFVAVMLAVGLLYVSMPFYNELVEKQLSFDLFDPLHLVCLLSIGLMAGLIAGSYPAFYLSSFNPAGVLKGIKIKGSGAVIFIRKGLVITQFTASIILIISTIIVYRQVQHIKDRDLGYSKDHLIYMDLQGNMKDHFSEIKNSLIATGYVENAATSLHDALHVYSYSDGFSWQGKDPNSKPSIHSNVVSAEYLSTMHIQLTAGRDFYQGNSDSANVIINQSLAKIMGKQGKLGSIINMGNYTLTVVGIIKDFIYNDVYGEGQPLVLFNGSYAATIMAVRFKPNVNLSQALQRTEAVMRSENPGFPFVYRFADKDFDAMFAVETLIGKLAGVFALLAVFISCLGLFGLAAYTAERRTKEMGIRKVLGASVAGLAGLLAREFLQLVALSCILAFPVAWWFMHDWLQDYAYRTTIQWWMFALAGLSALLTALITVSLQSIKAAMANPVTSLRSE
jgi:ABC-type antimicrobial peptide transport system permease subunit